MKPIIKFEFLKDDLVRLIFIDNTEEIIQMNQFNQYTNEGKITMAFIVP